MGNWGGARNQVLRIQGKTWIQMATEGHSLNEFPKNLNKKLNLIFNYTFFINDN